MIKRIATGVVAGIFIISMLIVGPLAITITIALMAAIAFWEWSSMSKLQHTFLAKAGTVLVFLLVIPWVHVMDLLEMPGHLVLLWVFLIGSLVWNVLKKNKIQIHSAALLVFGLFYVSFGFYHIALTAWVEHGIFWMVVILLTIISNDAGAYFSGMTFGKHPLAPTISPKKTWEGAIGGTLMTVLVVAIILWLFPDRIVIIQALGLSLAVILLAPLGDLMQSSYKRQFGVKDSGKILPGHGGILDRCDSWIVVFPVLHLLGLF